MEDKIELTITVGKDVTERLIVNTPVGFSGWVDNEIARIGDVALRAKLMDCLMRTFTSEIANHKRAKVKKEIYADIVDSTYTLFPRM